MPKLQYSEFKNENCPYMNRCSNCRDVYMSFNMDRAEDTLYSDVGFKNISSIDCSFSKETELCAYCVDSIRCYRSSDLVRCSGLSESHFCFDCHAGENLILCWNLRNKKYCILNEQLSKEEFLTRKAKFGLSTRAGRKRLREELRRVMREQAIHKYGNILNSENSSGDSIFESKNCHDCYDVMHGEDLTRVVSVDDDARSSMDSGYIWDGAELIYESMSVTGYEILFCFNVWETNAAAYSELCFGCNDIFGCCGLKKESFCILNRKYSEQDYRAMVGRIIRHMKETGEWGEFFPAFVSPLAYNESVASHFFPLERGKAQALGWHWKEEDPREYQAATVVLPDTASIAPDSITKETLSCVLCGKNYRIVSRELLLYRLMELPLPDHCPDCRHKHRLSLRNPFKLWERRCDGCQAPMRTTYEPSRSEKVLCESCYLAEVL